MKNNLVSFIAVLLVAILMLTSCGDSELVAEMESKIQELQGELDEVKEENALKDQEIGKLKEKNAEKDKEISDLKDDNAEKDKEISSLNEQIQGLLNDRDYTVTFNINGGIGKIESQIVRYQKTIDEPVAPTKEHYDFVGWYVNSEKVEFPYVVTCDTDFVAGYTPIKYTITYMVNDGTMPGTYTTEYNVETGVILPTPTRALYLFDGWYEDAKFEGAKVTSISVGEVGNKTYYAKWLSTTNGVTYKLSDDGTYYTVTGYDGNDTVIVISDIVDGIPVTRIADKAFQSKQRVISITVPDSVTYIGDSAFRDCISLTELNLGNGIKTIPNYMAYGCNKLQSIVIPDSVTTIGDDAFYGCSSLTSVYIYDLTNWCNISFSGYYYSNPLYYADNLYVNGELVTELVIPDDVTQIKSSAFNNFDGLTSVVISDSVTNIGDWTFYSCPNLKSVVIPDSVTTIGAYAFYYCDSLTSAVIGDNVTTIGSSAFYNCKSLTNIVIPDSVTSIGSSAFNGCSSLTSVAIPDSVTSIGQYAFQNCSSLFIVHNNSDLLLEIGSTTNGYITYYAKMFIENGVTTYRDDGYNYSLTDDGFLFREKNSKYELISYIGGEDTVTLPSDINGNSYALYYMSGVVNVIIPNTFSSINDYAFYGCKSLTSVVIPDSVTTIGAYAFWSCFNLQSIDIPDSVTSIGYSAFQNCKRLISVTIGNNVATIDSYAFEHCNSLTSVYINDISNWCNISFRDSSSNPLRYSNNLYVNKELVTKLVIPNDVTQINSYAFYNFDSLTDVVIGDSVTDISFEAFYACSSLTNVYYNDSATKWTNIYISYNNYQLTNATRYYYSETRPTEEGNFWHWGENGEVVVWE